MGKGTFVLNREPPLCTVDRGSTQRNDNNYQYLPLPFAELIGRLTEIMLSLFWQKKQFSDIAATHHYHYFDRLMPTLHQPCLRALSLSSGLGLSQAQLGSAMVLMLNTPEEAVLENLPLFYRYRDGNGNTTAFLEDTENHHWWAASTNNYTQPVNHHVHHVTKQSH